MEMLLKIKKALQEGGITVLLERIKWKLSSVVMPKTIAADFSHSIHRGIPKLPFAIKYRSIELPKDEVIAERILIAFKKAWNEERNYSVSDKEDAWDTIEANQHQNLLDILTTGSPRVLAEYLSNMHNTAVTYGISDFNKSDYNNATPRLRREHIACIKDRLVSLAEAVGAITYKRFSIDIYKDTDTLIKEIEASIGIGICPPDIDGGLVKLKTNKYLFSLRDLYSIYTAWRINQLVEKGSAIAEIGGGLGKTAVYANRFGFLDYSIFDLPQMNVIQAWYVLQSGMEVSLYGEEERLHSVKILPWRGFGERTQYNLILNADSFTEMETNIVKNYLEKIKLSTSQYLLSINHEKEQVSGDNSTTSSRLVMFRHINEIKGFKRRYRFPFWLRSGYVEELYEVETHT